MDQLKRSKSTWMPRWLASVLCGALRNLIVFGPLALP
jgi:hypothetical protein